MLERIHYLAKEQVDFAFETTLVSCTFVPWIKNLKQVGFIFHLVFLWLPSQEFAIARVAERVKMGGHNVPEETIRRRYHKGLKNFFQLYMQLADTWRLYDNSDTSGPALIASGEKKIREIVFEQNLWNKIREKYYE